MNYLRINLLNLLQSSGSLRLVFDFSFSLLFGF